MLYNDMNIDRIRRWKCLFCGSRQKRKIEIKDRYGKRAGYSLLCCNCGHIDNFALSPTGISVYVCGKESLINNVDIKCPFDLDDISFCKNVKCSYRPKPKEITSAQKDSSDITLSKTVLPDTQEHKLKYN